MVKILIACGGTGGHIFPALSVAGELKKVSNADLLFVTDQRAECVLLFRNGEYKKEILPAVPLPERVGLRTIKFLLKLGKAMSASLSIINRYKPDLVVGFGGYTSAPVVFSAYLLGLPTFIHEQNVVPGRANRFLSRFVNKIAISFKETERYFNRFKSKLILTGNPVRDDISKVTREDALKKFNFNKDKFTILVMGGSQGSHKINKVFIDALSDMEESLKVNLQVIHLVGKRDYEWVNLRYKALNVRVRTFDFLEDMGSAYHAADLVIGRAGASTISELTTLGLPAILIPYPYAQAHQSQNAKLLERQGAAVLIEDDALSIETLKRQIIELIKIKERLTTLAFNSKRLGNPSASHQLAKEILVEIRSRPVRNLVFL